MNRLIFYKITLLLKCFFLSGLSWALIIVYNSTFNNDLGLKRVYENNFFTSFIDNKNLTINNVKEAKINTLLIELISNNSLEFRTTASAILRENLKIIEHIDNDSPIFTSDPITFINDDEIYIYVISTEDPNGDNVTISANELPDFLSLVTIESGVSRFAGGGDSGFMDSSDPLSALFSFPNGIALDANGNLLIADELNNRIRIVDTNSGDVTTFAGSGSPGFLDSPNPLDAQFNSPIGIAVSSEGDVFVTESINNTIRKIDALSGAVTTIAGSGSSGFLDNEDPLLAEFFAPVSIAIDSEDNLYIADLLNHSIRRIGAVSGAVTTIAGTGNPGFQDSTNPLEAQFDLPRNVIIDSEGNLIVADILNNRIRTINLSNGLVSTLAGNGNSGFLDNEVGLLAEFDAPSGLAIINESQILVSELGNNVIRKIDLVTSTVTTIAGTGNPGDANNSNPLISSFNDPVGLAVDQNGTVFISELANNSIRSLNFEEARLVGDASGQSGTFPIILTAGDANGAITEQSFTLTVNDVNEAPVIRDQDFTVSENSSVNFLVGTLIATDPENDELVFSITEGNTNDVFNLNEATGELRVNNTDELGITDVFSLDVTVSDGVFNDRATVTVNILSNTAPMVSNPISDTTLTQGFTSFIIDLNNLFEDIDNDDIAIEATSADTSVATVSTDGLVLAINEEGVGISVITLTASDGFSSTSDEFLVTISPLVLNLEELVFNNLKIYPNPTSGHVFIDFSEKIPFIINVYDINGKRVVSSERSFIDISNELSGLYILQIESENQIYRTRIVKE